MREQPHISPKYYEDIAPRVLLHHSWTFIEERIQPRLEDVRELPNEDYRMISGNYEGKTVTAVETGMGVDESLNIVDQLAQLGKKVFIKLGTFVALANDIGLGDIHVPVSAVSLPSSVDSILRYGQRPQASRELVDCIISTAKAASLGLKTGTVLTCPLYGPFIRDEVINPIFSMDYWKSECFGDEMECAAVFAAAAFSGARAAAILVCNRTWRVLDEYRRGRHEDWKAHQECQRYKQMYERATDLALHSLIQCCIH